MAQPASHRPAVLVVDGQGSLTPHIRAVLEPAGYRVASVPTVLDGVTAVRRDRPAVVLASGDASSADTRLLIGLCRLGNQTPVVLVGREQAWLAKSERVPILTTPVEPAQLLSIVADLAEPTTVIASHPQDEI